jgi:hypothetical protein
MRQILTFFGLLLCITSFATASDAPNYRKTSIHIISNSYEQYEVRIDGRAYRLQNNDLRLNDISTGYHRLEVSKIERGSGGIFGSRDRTVTVYNNNINVSEGEQIEINIDRSGRVIVREYNNNTGGRYGQASMRVVSAAYDAYEVRIDGRSFRLTNNELRFDNLTTGMHRLEVVRIERGSTGIFGKRDRGINVYDRNLNVSSGEQIEVYINRNGNVDVRQNNNNRKGKNKGNRRWGNDDDRDHDRGYGNDRKF